MSNVTLQEARQIAEEAYIFAYPMLMSYRAIYVGGIDESSPIFRAPFNQIVHDSRPADHAREDVEGLGEVVANPRLLGERSEGGLEVFQLCFPLAHTLERRELTPELGAQSFFTAAHAAIVEPLAEIALETV